MKASSEAIIDDVLDDKVFIGITNFLTGSLTLLDKIIDRLGGIKPLLFTIGSFLISKNFSKLNDKFIGSIYNVMSLTKSGRNAINADRAAEL